jgi:hypothetical protein
LERFAVAAQKRARGAIGFGSGSHLAAVLAAVPVDVIGAAHGALS